MDSSSHPRRDRLSTPRGGRAGAATAPRALAIGVLALFLSACGSGGGEALHGKGFPALFRYPNDGRLYAAAGCSTITPNESNHPATLYLAGTDMDRVALGVHDDLESCTLVMGTRDQYLIVAALDLIGVPAPRTNAVRDALADRFGIDPNRVMVHATHCHNGPDTIGMYGRDDFHSGRDPVYDQFLASAVVDQIIELAPKMEEVELTVASATIHDPLSNYPSYLRDFRYPMVLDDRLFAARLDARGRGGAVATIVNWTNHAEIASGHDAPGDTNRMISADFPSQMRKRLEMEDGGVGFYWAGAGGGMTTPFGVSVPLRDEAGGAVLSGGEPVYVAEETWDKVRSLGFVIAETAIGALNAAAPSGVERIDVTRADTLLPVTNVNIFVGDLLGIIERQNIVRTAGCGLFGCLAQPLWLIEIGDDWQIVTSPGESFPESTIGRQASTHDFGDPYGVLTFPAMEGIRKHYTAPCAMYLGLTGNEIGYIVPETDWNQDPPDNYCEYFDLSPKTETILHRAQIELLDGASQRARGGAKLRSERMDGQPAS